MDFVILFMVSSWKRGLDLSLKTRFFFLGTSCLETAVSSISAKVYGKICVLNVLTITIIAIYIVKNNRRNSNGWKFIKRMTKTKCVFRYENKSRLTGQSEPEKDWCTRRDRGGNEQRSSTRQSENFVFSDTQRKMWVEWKIISEQRDDDELNYFIINSVFKSHFRL